MAFEEVFLLGFASSGRVKVVMVAMLKLAHEEVARVDLSVDSNFRVGHLNIIVKMVIITASSILYWDYHLDSQQAELSYL